MEIKLPINYNPIIKFECWTFFRTSIISAYKELEGWFINHLNDICITSQYDCDFGSNGKKYNIVSHYEQVLEFEERTFAEINEDFIVRRMCDHIDNGTYIIIDIDSSKIYDDIHEPFVAQFLIYGYDDERQVFFSPSIRGGHWHEIEIQWDDFVQAYIVRKAYTREQVLASTNRQNPFPLLLVRPKIETKQNILFSAFFNEIRSAIAQSNEVFLCKEEGLLFRQGILGTYGGLEEFTKKLYNKEIKIYDLGYDHDVRSGFIKIVEFNIMLEKRLHYIDDFFCLHIQSHIYEKMHDLVVSTETTKNLVLKYQAEKNEMLLLKVVERLQAEKRIHVSLYEELLSTMQERFTGER